MDSSFILPANRLRYEPICNSVIMSLFRYVALSPSRSFNTNPVKQTRPSPGVHIWHLPFGLSFSLFFLFECLLFSFSFNNSLLALSLYNFFLR